MTEQAKQVPLIERLEAVPAYARLTIHDGHYSTSYYPVGAMTHEAAAELRRLHGENERLRALIRLDDAEWRDKEIWPCVGDAYQAWLVQVYLPVPLSAADKSPEAALERALAQEGKT
jgi:hypothetical protein